MRYFFRDLEYTSHLILIFYFLGLLRGNRSSFLILIICVAIEKFITTQFYLIAEPKLSKFGKIGILLILGAYDFILISSLTEICQIDFNGNTFWLTIALFFSGSINQTEKEE